MCRRDSTFLPLCVCVCFALVFFAFFSCFATDAPIEDDDDDVDKHLTTTTTHTHCFKTILCFPYRLVSLYVVVVVMVCMNTLFILIGE
jgi:hypothetical protein